MIAIVTHTFTIQSRCPVDTSVVDVYEVVVKTSRTIEVHEMAKAAREIAQREPIFQEDLTMRLAMEFECEVTTTGMHKDIVTRVECRY